MKFQTIEDLESIREIYPLMKQLRPHLSEDNFVELYQEAFEKSHYTLIGAFKNKEDCQGLMGFRFLTDFVHGRHLYIDDLVVSIEHRSKGLGSKFLDYARDLARKENCTQIRLCTGIQNKEGKKFYEKNNLELRAVAYKEKLATAFFASK